MAVTTDDSTDAHRIEHTDEIDLATYADAFPEGTTVEMSFRGTPSQFTVELTRNGDRFLIEGDGATAELTGVVGADRTPDRVPDWIAVVLEAECDVREVSVYR